MKKLLVLLFIVFGLSGYAQDNTVIRIGGLKNATLSGTTVSTWKADDRNGATRKAIANYVEINGGSGGGTTIDTSRLAFLAKSNIFTGDSTYFNGKFAGGLGSVASGIGSFAFGIRDTASGIGAVALGGTYFVEEGDTTFMGNKASGEGSFASGVYTTASGAGSFAAGMNSIADKYAQQAHAGGQFADQGDAQHSIFIMRQSITHSDANWHQLYLDADTANIWLAANQTLAFDVQLVGSTAGQTKDF
jgi:hypothetical protein